MKVGFLRFHVNVDTCWRAFTRRLCVRHWVCKIQWDFWNVCWSCREAMILKQVLGVPEAFWIERELNQELEQEIRIFLLGLMQMADFSSILFNYHYWKLCLIFSSVHLHRLWRILPILFGFSMFIWIEKTNSRVLFLFRLFIYLFLLCVESEPKELSCMLLRQNSELKNAKFHSTEGNWWVGC